MTRVQLIEVSPRDGLQNEARTLPTATKVELISRCAQAGLSRIEAVSFAHPRLVPQLADAEAVLAAERIAGVSYSALVLNRKGLARALAAGVDEINYVVLATETFSRRNQSMSVADSVASWLDIAAQARSHGLRSAVTISAAFGCPFEGDVASTQVIRLVERVLAGLPDEVVLADTIGVGVPRQVRDLVAGCRTIDANITLRAHFHDTRNTGIANALTAVDCGLLALDSSAGGIGGCPFAPAATGNIATEDLLYALHRSGHVTGVDLDAVAATGSWIAAELGKPQAPAVLGRAGDFPPTVAG